jgi:4-amino-4-deoxy-L-arabinose transferase-like glycosyltransferase
VNFALKITKIDILTMILLSIVFFGMAIYNLGQIEYPVTKWQSTTSQSFYVDLGSSQFVQTAFFWVKSGNADVSVYSGEPGSWSYVGNFSLIDRDTDYSIQKDMSLNVQTRYLEFNIQPITYDSRSMFNNIGILSNPHDKAPSPYAEVSEIGIENPDFEQIPIVSITGINGTDSTLNMLVDEQNTLEIPPTYMSKMYFDEVYFARSAENYLNHVLPDERTHPPLGKLIQAVGVAVFGEIPFGWRIMGVIFGAFMVPLMFLIAKKLFGTWIGGFSAAFLFTFDFMHFTMARIGTVDTYVVFFSLLTQLCFLIYFARVLRDGWKTSVVPLFLAAVFAALAFSTKWFSLFGVLGMLALLVVLRLREVAKLKEGLREKYVAFFEHPFLLMLAFVGVFVAIYFATYIPEMLMDDSPMTIYKLQNAMLGFHSGNVPDPSASPWWSWPLMFRLDGAPVSRWFDVTYNLPNNTMSSISVFGNPAIWWIGFAAMLFLIIEAFHLEAAAANLWRRIKKSSVAQQVSIRGQGWDVSAIFIVVVFLFYWLPYLLIGRATYIYHYYLSVPLICLAITYFINKYWHKPLGKVAAIVIFAAAVGMFVLFYPVFSGAPATSDAIRNLIWFHSWGFLG